MIKTLLTLIAVITAFLIGLNLREDKVIVQKTEPVTVDIYYNAQLACKDEFCYEMIDRGELSCFHKVACLRFHMKDEVQ